MVYPAKLTFLALCASQMPISSLRNQNGSVLREQKTSGFGITGVGAIQPNTVLGEEYTDKHTQMVLSQIKDVGIARNLDQTPEALSEEQELIKKLGRLRMQKFFSSLQKTTVSSLVNTLLENKEPKKIESAIKIGFTAYMQNIFAVTKQNFSEQQVQQFKNIIEMKTTKSKFSKQIKEELGKLNPKQVFDDIQKKFSSPDELLLAIFKFHEFKSKPEANGIKISYLQSGTTQRGDTKYQDQPYLGHPVVPYDPTHNCHASAAGIDQHLDEIQDKEGNYPLLERLGYKKVTSYSARKKLDDYIKPDHTYFLVYEKDSQHIHSAQITNYNGEQGVLISKNGGRTEGRYFDLQSIENVYGTKPTKLYEIPNKELGKVKQQHDEL